MSNTLRLIYPQWQGGVISPLVPELTPADANLGYVLGSQLLDFLAPKNAEHKTAVVPVSTANPEDRRATGGISNWPEIKAQTLAAFEILNRENPDRIITLGGECRVSVAPFTWLAQKYGPKTAMIWIDAHCDINLPSDPYTGYHAMALAACLGKCGDEVTSLFPATFDISNIMAVGIREWDVGIKERQQEFGLKHVTAQELHQNSEVISAWLKQIGAEKVVIHFDLDALDPQELFCAVGLVPDGIKIADAVQLINKIDAEFDLVGLTLAEPMPRIAIKLKNMLSALHPLQ